MMYYYGGGPGIFWGWGLLGGILNILILVLIISIIVRIIRGRRHHMRGDWKGEWHKMMGNQGAVDILRERYAKGEIDKAEYEERKKVLEADAK